jgi:hypothetical protein
LRPHGFGDGINRFAAIALNRPFPEVPAREATRSSHS